MADLRAHFDALRFSRVETFIQSGNVLFDSTSRDLPGLEAKIERRLESKLGYPVATFLRPLADLAAVAGHRPFPEGGSNDGAKLYVGFLKSALTAERETAVRALDNPIDELRVVGCELYWLCRKGFGESAVSGPRLERALGGPVTIRSLVSLGKLIAKHAGPDR